MEEVNEWFAPPTPARLGIQQNAISPDCDDVPIDNSLVFLTGEVVEAQKYQTNQMSNKEDLLNCLQLELETALKVYEKTEEDLKSLNRKLYLIQDSSLIVKKSCTELQKDIVSLLKEKQVLHNKLLETKWSQRKSASEFQIYKEKMVSFHKSMRYHFDDNKLQKEVVSLRDQNAESKRFVSISNEEGLLSRDEIEVMTGELRSDEEEVLLSQRNVSSLKEQTILLRKEVDALNKRNIAHMSRLKHHLEEEINKCSDLKSNIAKIDLQIKELE